MHPDPAKTPADLRRDIAVEAGPGLSRPPSPPGQIQLNLRELAQLFNSMDPSPFQDKDLDDDAVDYIVGWAKETPRGAVLNLLVHLQQRPAHPDPQYLVEAAVHNFFNHRAVQTRRELRFLFRRGQVSLLIGLVFLAACLGVVDLLSHWDSTWVQVLRESLTIGGWVAMWRPMEIYLYDWWPLRHLEMTYRKLAAMSVAVKVAEA